ncbi:MAG: chemotaxis protein CheW [Caulobacter sp.]
MAVARRLLVHTGDLRLAIDVAHVREIAVMPDLIPLPNGPAAALGVALLRGELTPVIDLGRLIDPAAARAAPTRIVSLVSPSAALAVEHVEALELTDDEAPFSLQIEGRRRPYDLPQVLDRCFEDAWRQVRTATT